MNLNLKTIKKKRDPEKKIRDKSGTTGANYAKYTTLAVQLCVIMFVLAWLGRYLDSWIGNEKPWFTITLCLFGVAIIIYLLIKMNNRLKK